MSGNRASFLGGRQIVFALIAIALAACGTLSAEATSTSVPTFVPSETPIILPTETIAASSPTPLPPFPLDGYIIIFNQDNNLYFQDGNNSAVRLTHDGEMPHSPLISDDNKKIVFVRGDSSDDGYLNLYSVNADGSGELALITSAWLAELGEETRIRFPAFVPNSHQLLFSTYLCESHELNSACSVGIFLVDTDKREITPIQSPGAASQYNPNSIFKISPNGKMISIASSGHIDILGIDGKMIRKDILPYTPSKPSELFPEQYWLPDSSGLILALPTVTEYGWAFPPRPTYSVWRYNVDNDVAVQVPIEPLPRLPYWGCGNVITVSPDGDWILYGGDGTNAPSQLYIGNLINSQTQMYQQYRCPINASSWSPDSKYFVFGNVLGAIDTPSIPIGPIHSSFLKWIDNNHYIYIVGEENSFETRVGEINGEVILSHDLGPFSLIKPK